MHEQSLVAALLEQVQRHAPAGAIVRTVRVHAGAMRAIEPELMHWAWEAGKGGTTLASAALELTIDSYDMTCPACGRRWKSDTIAERCACGCTAPTAGGSDELMLMALEIDEPERVTP